MSSNEVEKGDQFNFLFGTPPLLEGEDPKHYEGLRAAIIGDLKPKSALDWINVHDVVTKLWEERRFRKASAAIIRGGMLKAVLHYLQEICMGAPPFLFEKAETKALQYFSSNPKERREVVSLLAQHGITAAQIEAKAAQLEVAAF